MAAAMAAMIAGVALPATAAVQKTVLTFAQFQQLTGVPVVRVKNGKTQYAQFANRPTIKQNGFTIFVMKTGKVVIRVNTDILKKPTTKVAQFTLPGQGKPINITFTATPGSTSSSVSLGGFPAGPVPVSPS
jgi:hypothetical protein